MHKAVVVSGVLGLGTAIVFGAAALAATMFPNGGTVSMGWNGGVTMDKGFAVPPGAVAPAPMPFPVTIDGSGGNEKGIVVAPDQP